jgi:hypothetical protein
VFLRIDVISPRRRGCRPVPRVIADGCDDPAPELILADGTDQELPRSMETSIPRTWRGRIAVGERPVAVDAIVGEDCDEAGHGQLVHDDARPLNRGIPFPQALGDAAMQPPHTALGLRDHLSTANAEFDPPLKIGEPLRVILCGVRAAVVVTAEPASEEVRLGASLACRTRNRHALNFGRREAGSHRGMPMREDSGVAGAEVVAKLESVPPARHGALTRQ